MRVATGGLHKIYRELEGYLGSGLVGAWSVMMADSIGHRRPSFLPSGARKTRSGARPVPNHVALCRPL